MSDRAMLSPAERQAIKAELELIQKQRSWKQGQLGDWLGLTQQAMSKALAGKAGPIVASALYEKAATTRADLIAKHRGMIPDQFAEEVEADEGLEGTGISVNRRRAIAAFDWEGVEPHEYETVHNQLAADYFATGIDPEPEYWLARIRTLLAAVRGKPKRVPDPAHDETPEERDARELAEHKASRKKPPEPPKRPGNKR